MTRQSGTTKKAKITKAKGNDRSVALCLFTSNMFPPKKSAATVEAAADYINMP